MAEFDLIGVDAVTGKMGKTSTSDTLNINLASLKDVSLTSPQTGDILVRTENGWSSSSPEPPEAQFVQTDTFTGFLVPATDVQAALNLLDSRLKYETVVLEDFLYRPSISPHGVLNQFRLFELDAAIEFSSNVFSSGGVWCTFFRCRNLRNYRNGGIRYRHHSK